MILDLQYGIDYNLEQITPKKFRVVILDNSKLMTDSKLILNLDKNIVQSINNIKLSGELLGKEFEIIKIPTLVPTDYISYYKFDGNTLDETGNYNATNNGATLTEGVKGLPNTAYSFNGIDNFMQIPIGNISPEKTYSIWVKLLVIKNSSIITYTDSSMGDHSVSDDLRIIGSRFRIYTFDGSVKEYEHNSDIILNDWYHVVVTIKNNSEMKLFVNGEYSGSVLIGTKWASGDRHLIGRSGVGYLNGLLDNIRIYDRVLTQEEITTIYNYER
jgi:hypothetical protein